MQKFYLLNCIFFFNYITLSCLDLLKILKYCQIKVVNIFYFQAIVNKSVKNVEVLWSVFCHHCELLSQIEGQAGQILQFSCMDILTRLSNRTDTKKKFGTEFSWKGSDKVSAADFICCIKENGIQKALLKQYQSCSLQVCVYLYKF